jgi:hypothetical protein
MTALDIINRALRLLGVIANGEAATGAEASDALSVLNSLIQSFGNESLLIFADSTDQIAVAAGQGSLTIGPSGSTVSPRPVRVLETTYLQLGDLSYPLVPLNPWEYNAIGLKAQTTGIPDSIYVEAGMPNTTIYLYPVPSQDVTLVLRSNKRLATLNLTDQISFPDGYERMLAYCLAVDLAPEYDRQLRPDVLRIAVASKKTLKRANAQIPRMDMPGGIPGCGSGVGISGGRAGSSAIVNNDGEFLVYT